MKNLLERATPELKKAIAVYTVDYPHSGEMIQEDLRANNWVAFLKYGTVVSLRNAAQAAGFEFSFTDPWSHFERL